MYAIPILSAGREFADECGFEMKYTQGGPTGTTGWLGIYYQYAAMQLGFRQVDGNSSGGGHFGMLWSYDTDPGHWDMNFGFYDDIAGGGVTCRGTKPYLSAGTPFVQINPPTGEESYSWYQNGVAGTQGLPYGDWFQCRVFVSPKQDWTASALTAGWPQPEYNNVNQKTSGTLGAETAIRMVYRTKVAGTSAWTPWMWFRDVLFKNLAASKPLQGPQLWLENTLDHNVANTPHFADGDWPNDPTWQFRNVIWDGARTIKKWEVQYGAADINPATKKSDVRLITDNSVQWIQQISNNAGLTRQNAHLAQLTPTESTFWDAGPSNVTPAITDNAARVATLRPWY